MLVRQSVFAAWTAAQSPVAAAAHLNPSTSSLATLSAVILGRPLVDDPPAELRCKLDNRYRSKAAGCCLPPRVFDGLQRVCWHLKARANSHESRGQGVSDTGKERQRDTLLVIYTETRNSSSASRVVKPKTTTRS